VKHTADDTDVKAILAARRPPESRDGRPRLLCTRPWTVFNQRVPDMPGVRRRSEQHPLPGGRAGGWRAPRAAEGPGAGTAAVRRPAPARPAPTRGPCRRRKRAGALLQGEADRGAAQRAEPGRGNAKRGLVGSQGDGDASHTPRSAG
jgi:hypothetical protein